MEQLEVLCRLLCKAQNIDPDKEGLGCGGIMPRDSQYKLWEAQIRIAEFLIKEGYHV